MDEGVLEGARAREPGVSSVLTCALSFLGRWGSRGVGANLDGYNGTDRKGSVATFSEVFAIRNGH